MPKRGAIQRKREYKDIYFSYGLAEEILVNLEILVSVTNEIMQLENPTVGDLWKVYAVGCRALTMLLGDERLLSEIQSSLRTSSALREDIRRTLDDVKQYAAFLALEEKCLIEAGVRPCAAGILVREAREASNQIANRQIEPETVPQGIAKLRTEVCHMETQLGRLADHEKSRPNVKGLLRKVGWVIGGVTLIVINGNAVAALGLYATVSVGIGCDLVVKGISE